MIKYLLLFIVCIIEGSFAFAQDSSYQHLMAAKDDTSKVNQLHAYAQELLDKDNKKARGIYTITLGLSAKLNYDLGTATAYRKIGYINGQEGQYLDAIDCFRKAIAYYEKGNGHIKNMIVCINNIGANFRQLGK